MKPTDEIKFGKYKGQTLEQACQIEAGRDYFKWFCSQPCNEPKYAIQDAARKKSILKYIESIEGSTLPKVNEKVMDTIDILTKLNNIEAKIDILLAGRHIAGIVPSSKEEEEHTEQEHWDE